MDTQEQTPKLMNTAEAAKFLSLKPSMIRSMVFKKEIPTLKIGRLVMFDRADLLKWLDSKRTWKKDSSGWRNNHSLFAKNRKSRA